MGEERELKSFWFKDVMPFVGMVAMECANVGLNTLYKAATLKGMSHHVFVVYSYGLAAFLLLPSYFFNRSRLLPPLNFSVLWKIFLLGLIGGSSQMIGYTGIKYSSPTLASAISNLVPAFTFILAIIFRMETVTLKSSSSLAKVCGTAISIIGAFVVTLFKGPKIIFTQPSLSSSMPLLLSSNSCWILGSLFLTIEYILVPMWYIVQAQIMKEYPAEVAVVCYYNLCVSFLAAIVAIFAEPDLNKWKIRPDIALASIVCSGIFGSFLNNTVHTWVLRLKGPVYVTMFKPLSIAIAVAMGVIILGDTLYLGSILGAAVIGIGFYTVLWGKATEDKEAYNEFSVLESSEPLLQHQRSDNILK